MIGEGKYNLDALKEIRVTESYLGMDMGIRKCQNEEPLENCTTRTYMDSFLQQCGCLPLRLASFKNVIFKPSKLNSSIHHLISQEPICTPQQLQCVENVKANVSMCIKSCNGMMITGFTKSELNKYPEENIQKTLIAYEHYKSSFQFPSGIKGLN